MRTGNPANDPYKIIKGTRVLSVWEWQQLISTPKKYSFKHKKKGKIPKIRTPSSMCSRGSGQIIKIVLVMLISGILLSGKHPKRYQLGLKFETPWKVPDHWFWPLKGTTSILTHFRSPPPPPPPPTLSAPKNKRCDLPTTSCQSHLVKFTWTSYLLIKTFRHWSVRFLCWQNLSCFEAGRLYFFLFCSSWHNLVGIKITVRLHLLNRLFKCIQNSMCALLVH